MTSRGWFAPDITRILQNRKVQNPSWLLCGPDPQLQDTSVGGYCCQSWVKLLLNPRVHILFVTLHSESRHSMLSKNLCHCMWDHIYAEIQAIIGKMFTYFFLQLYAFHLWVNLVFVSSTSCHTWCGIACPLKEETCFTSNLPQYRSICVPCCARIQKHWADFYAGGIQWHLCHQLISRQDSLLIQRRRKSWHTVVQEGKKKGRKRKMQCNFF